MSLFGPSVKYSLNKHQLTTEDLRHILWHVHLAVISEANKQAVQQEILARRVEGDKISLQTIYETLTKMKDLSQISKFDRDQFMKIFQEYFTRHFGA